MQLCLGSLQSKVWNLNKKDERGVPFGQIADAAQCADALQREEKNGSLTRFGEVNLWRSV
jgi:hypothetical protein